MFDTTLKKKRAAGLVLLAVLLTLFLWFNRIPKLDTVEQDLVNATAPLGEAQCFQGLCIDGNPESTLLSRWWEFSLTYLELVALGMTFAFLVAGLAHVFLLPQEGGTVWSQRGIKGSLRGLMVGPVMNLCSACIVPVSIAFRRRGAGIETTVAIVQGSSTTNLPAMIMAAMVFAPLLAGSRVGISVIGALLLGPLVAFLSRQRDPEPEASAIPVDTQEPQSNLPWREVIAQGLRDWAFASAGYLVRLGPIMVLAGFASGLVIQWVSPDAVQRFLGNDFQGIAIAATLGLLINVPLMFEIPLVAALLMVGMGTAPAATLLFAAAAGGPITFWGLARVLRRRTVFVFAGATWALGVAAGLAILGIGLVTGVGQPQAVELASPTAHNLREAVSRAGHGDTIQLPAGIYTFSDGELVVNKDLKLAGAGPGHTVLQAADAPGVADNRVLSVEFGRDVEISGVTVRHGLVDSTEERHLYFPATASGMVAINLEFGGGIHVHGDLRLTNAVVTANQAGGGGGIFNGGTLTLVNTAVSNNLADASGGGIFNGGIVLVQDSVFAGNYAASGGAVYNMGEMTFAQSTIGSNQSKHGGGGIANTSVGRTTLEHTTVSRNRSLHGAGVRNEGHLTIANSTLSNNIGRRGAGVINSDRLTVTNSTISGNQASFGGGIAIYNPSMRSATKIANTIIAGNTAAESPDCLGAVVSLGYNLLGSASGCAYSAAHGDLLGAGSEPLDPRLGDLDDNGGPTETHALLFDSPAIDGGNGALAPDTDQRGFLRPRGGASDIGAYEHGS